MENTQPKKESQNTIPSYEEYYDQTLAWWRKNHPNSSLPRNHVIESSYDEKYSTDKPTYKEFRSDIIAQYKLVGNEEDIPTDAEIRHLYEITYCSECNRQMSEVVKLQEERYNSGKVKTATTYYKCPCGFETEGSTEEL
jgi:hypothetical protein